MQIIIICVLKEFGQPKRANHFEWITDNTPHHITHGLTQRWILFQVLSGYVNSVEDHGYLISFGIDDTRAFLPKSKLNTGIKLI